MTSPRPVPLTDPHPHAAQPARETAGSPASRAFVRDMEEGMRQMMREMHAPGYSGNPDVDFLAMMIPHHAGAVAMARLVLLHGNDPLTRQLAEGIIASQSAEIDMMRQRLAILRRGDDPEPDGYPALQGTRGERAWRWPTR